MLQTARKGYGVFATIGVELKKYPTRDAKKFPVHAFLEAFREILNGGSRND